MICWRWFACRCPAAGIGGGWRARSLGKRWGLERTQDLISFRLGLGFAYSTSASAFLSRHEACLLLAKAFQVQHHQQSTPQPTIRTSVCFVAFSARTSLWALCFFDVSFLLSSSLAVNRGLAMADQHDRGLLLLGSSHIFRKSPPLVLLRVQQHFLENQLLHILLY